MDREQEGQRNKPKQDDIPGVNGLGGRLARLRVEKGYTPIEKLANILNCQKSTISRWEKGDNKPDYETLVKLSELYNVTIDYLITGTSTEHVEASRKYGLSDEALNVLADMSSPAYFVPHWSRSAIDLKLSDFINQLLTSPQLPAIAKMVLELQYYQAYMRGMHPEQPKRKGEMVIIKRVMLNADYEFAAIRGVTPLSAQETAKYKRVLIQNEITQLVKSLVIQPPSDTKRVDELVNQALKTIDRVTKDVDIPPFKHIELEEDSDEQS